MAKGTGAYDDPILVDGLFTKKINVVKKFFKLNSNGKDYSQLQAEINNTIEQLRLNTNNSLTALQTSIDRHTKELDNCVRSVNGVNADTSGNVQLGNIGAITGEIKWFAFNTVPDGYIICIGAKVSRETYADLFDAIGTAFGDGDGSTTFDLPDLIDRFAQGSRTVGTYKSAGLPNITGTVDGYMNMRASDGAFYLFNMDKGHGAPDDEYYHGLDFNASKSNPIYGNSTTVQPPALTLLPCIKY